jgi:hypothetical protein
MITAKSKPTRVNSKMEFTQLIENEPAPMPGEQQELRDAMITIAPQSTASVVRCFWKANLYVCSR